MLTGWSSSLTSKVSFDRHSELINMLDYAPFGNGNILLLSLRVVRSLAGAYGIESTLLERGINGFPPTAFLVCSDKSE